MDKIEEDYQLWRWAKYNEIDIPFLQGCIDNPYILNNPYDEVGLSKRYTAEIIKNYQCKTFDVSNEMIEDYDKKVKGNFEHFFSMYSKHLYSTFQRSIFIENSFIKVNQNDKKDLFEKIKANFIYFQWWDIITFEELGKSLVENHFLNSTIKLISDQELFKYFKNRFSSKEDFISCLLMNFIPSEMHINQMIEEVGGIPFFKNTWLFSNEFKKSIRIFENECRFEFNQKIIGSFFNEDLLFRAIKREFGAKFSVISQGSPDWLTPQRFDIYFSDLNIAIEYQGEQHFRPVDFGGKGEKFAKKQFQENLKRDNIKKEKAQKNNCFLLCVNPDYDINFIFQSIKEIIISKTKKDSVLP
ncbi:MAG TPA: hypothetical protein VFC65_03675 [Prolixibacteraceae bacterium]|nr:hypothetical protein [Prolixibacteraceae bacterium]